jgi:hypothetical protein
LEPVLCAEGLKKIKRWQLTVRLDTDPRFTLDQATAAFSNAEYLEIRVWQSMFDGCDSSVLKLFTGIRGVGIAKVSGCADPELARWLEGRMMRPLEEKGIEGDIEEVCGYKGETEARCTRRCRRVGGDGKWFGGMEAERDVWTFGNK